MLQGEFNELVNEDKDKFDPKKEDSFVYMHRMIKAGVSEVDVHC